jgi:hypothetical protein
MESAGPVKTQTGHLQLDKKEPGPKPGLFLDE